MAKIKKKDFVEIEYTGSTKDGEVFDTTREKEAKEQGIHEEKMEYGPVVVCVGENQILPGLDKSLEGKESGKEYTVELKAEEAFGKKDAKLIQLVQTSKFLKQNIQPVPGLQVNIDGTMATIKTVSGGRTLLDFNHPLAGKDITYKLKINNIVEDKAKQIRSYLKLSLGMEDADVELKDGKAAINIKKDIPKEIKEKLKEKIKELIDVKIEFAVKQEDKQ
jgi:FKBP-type peptidyl-prolyl cis-trans isomerase SlyD